MIKRYQNEIKTESVRRVGMIYTDKKKIDKKLFQYSKKIFFDESIHQNNIFVQYVLQGPEQQTIRCSRIIKKFFVSLTVVPSSQTKDVI